MKYIILRAIYATIILFGLVGIPSSVHADDSDIYKIESCHIIGADSVEAKICMIGANNNKTLAMACVSPLNETWPNALNARIGDSFIIEHKSILEFSSHLYDIKHIIRDTKIDVSRDPCLISLYSALAANYLTSGDD